MSDKPPGPTRPNAGETIDIDTTLLRDYATALQELQALRQASFDLVASHYPPGTRIQTDHGPATVLDTDIPTRLNYACLLRYKDDEGTYRYMAILDQVPKKLGNK